MSNEPKKNARLAPLTDAYEPTDAELERLFTKIQTSIAESPRSPLTTAGGWHARKGLLFGLSCVVVGIAGALAFTAEHARPAPAPSNTAMPTVEGAPSMAVDALPNAEPASAPTTTNEAPLPLPSASAVTSTSERAPKLPAKPASSAVPSEDTLAAEARMLAEAVRVNQSGDPARALAILDEHARTFPKGWLRDERAAERILVLCSLGRRDDAASEAAAFLDGRPKSALTRRVEMSCGRQP